MVKKYLIDSNTIIDFCNGKLPINGRNFLMEISPEISIITNIELFATKNISQEEYELLEKFVAFSIVHEVDKDLINTTIEIRQTYKIKLPDAIIAATALVYGMTLVSRNSKDFDAIEGLEFLNPYNIS
jgi:predicted nucleic acid-binding protein